MGRSAWNLDFGALSNRLHPAAVGRRIWVIAGEGRPRQYYLVGWFIVNRVARASGVDADFDWAYSGKKGRLTRRASADNEITKKTWFPALRRACANFATLQHVRDRTLLRHLNAMAQSLKPAKR